MKPRCVWLSGLSGSGKTTIGRSLVGILGRAVLLDGDELRRGVSSDLGFSIQDRQTNHNRAAHVAKILVAQGYMPVVAMISPTRAIREQARMIVGAQSLLVHLDVPISVCQQRDPKRLYARQAEHMTGIGSPYEPPDDAELPLRLDTSRLEIGDCVASIVALVDRGPYR